MLVGVKRNLTVFIRKISSSLSEVYEAKSSAINHGILTVWKDPGAIQQSGNTKLTMKIPATLEKPSIR